MNFSWTPREKKLAILLAITLVCLGSMIFYSQMNSKQDLVLPTEEAQFEKAVQEESMETQVVEEEKKLWIDLQGAVQRPGVYQLASGSRMNDVVILAGGLLSSAERRAVNLAQTIQDGEVIYIPTKEEWEKGEGKFSILNPATSKDAKKDLISINTASADELSSLPGIGETKAAAIIDYREKNGPFQTKEEVMEVSGIGEKLFEKMKDQITLQ